MRKLLLVPLLLAAVSGFTAVCAAASAGVPPDRIDVLRDRPATASVQPLTRITSPSTFAMGAAAFAAFVALERRRRRMLATSAL